MAISTTPRTFGAALVVAQIVDLATLSSDGLTLGTQVYVSATGSYFVLALSSASVNHTTVEAVDGIAGARWLLVTAGGTVTSVVAGSGISVDSSTPAAPVIAKANIPWVEQQFLAAKALVPALNAYCDIGDFLLTTWGKVGSDTNSGTQLTTENGGIVQLALTAGDSVAFKTGVSNIKTQSWAIASRFKMVTNPSGGAGEEMWQVAMFNSARTHFVGMELDETVSAGAILQLRLKDAAATTVAGTGGGATPGATWHDGLLTFDGTTVKALVDGVLIASTATLTNMPTDPGIPAARGNLDGTHGKMNLDQMMFAFVRV